MRMTLLLASILATGCATTGTQMKIDPGTNVHIEWRQGGVQQKVDLPSANACIIIKPREETCRALN